jgi:hypothetical protein
MKEESKDKSSEEKKNEDNADSNHDEKVDYDGDFPIPYKNTDLGKNWYEFNDSFVRPIVPGRLESQFGNGSSNQNAYILIYKRKGLNENPIYEDIPPYWAEEISRHNVQAA